MRDLNLLNVYRIIDPRVDWAGDDRCGSFELISKSSGQSLRIIASSDCGWDHVSVSLPSRCPNWLEMEQVRRMFFNDDEAVMQYHAPVADYVDGSYQGHPYCLHLWRPIHEHVPKPPKWMVGGMTVNEANDLAREEIQSRGGSVVR